MPQTDFVFLCQILKDKGYPQLILQIGRGAEPQIPEMQGINISWYRLKENILADMEAASLIISHAGAGSCLEALSLAKPLIVVVNQNLMGNHQMELAEKLHNEGHSLMCYPQTLSNTLKDLNISNLKVFPSNNPTTFSEYIEKLMGFC